MAIVPSIPQASRRQTLLAAIQSTAAFEALTATDAIEAFNVTANYQDDEVVRETIKRTYGNREVASTNRRGTLSFSVEISGSGANDVKPPHGILLRGSGMAEDVRADDAAGTIDDQANPYGRVTGAFTYTKTTAYTGSEIRRVTLTCTTGGGSGTAEFTVSSPAIGAEAAYSVTGVTMTDATAFALPNDAEITPTIGTPFAVGDIFTVLLFPPGTYYQKSSDRENHEVLSLEFNQDGERHRFLGSKGSITLSNQIGQYGTMTFSMIGLFVAPSTAVLPATNLNDWIDPEPIDFENTRLSQLNGSDVVLSSFELDMGGQVSVVNRVNRRAIRINEFQPSGTAVIENPSQSEIDLVNLRKTSQRVPFQFGHGTADGKKFDVILPSVQIGQRSLQDADGDVMASVPMRPLETAGDDEAIFAFR